MVLNELAGCRIGTLNEVTFLVWLFPCSFFMRWFLLSFLFVRGKEYVLTKWMETLHSGVAHFFLTLLVQGNFGK